MSDQNPEQPQNPPTGAATPPSVEPVAPPSGEQETPDVNPETAAAVGEPDGNAVDASEDPNLGHAFDDQSQGVGVGPSQTTADVEGTDGDDDEAAAL